MTPDEAIWWLKLKAKQKQKEGASIFQGHPLPVTDITAEPIGKGKYLAEFDKQNPRQEYKETNEYIRIFQPEKVVQKQAWRDAERNRLRNIYAESYMIRDKVKATLNPKNWGVPDYTDKGSRSAAFTAARKAGEKEFMWNNKRFNTKSDLSEEKQMKTYGITDNQRHVKTSLIDDTWLRKNLSTLNTSNGYDIPLGVVKDVMLGNPIKDENYKLHEIDMNDLSKKEQDAFNLYMGLPQQYGTFKPSKYKKGSFELNNYLQKFPEEMPSDDLINLVGRPLKAKELLEEIKSENLSTEDRLKKYDVFNKAYQIKPYSDMVLGRHTVRKGKDESGEYVEYIDNWDLDTYNYTISKKQLPFGIETPEIKVPIGSVADKLNKPFNIYGRQYYKDYGDGIKRKQYYSDKELSELDINKKDFDTLALQRELSNRGYKLPKSTKENGTFDGIWGDETKNALLDYQIKNK